MAVGRPDNKQNCCRISEECDCEELGSPFACGVHLFSTVLGSPTLVRASNNNINVLVPGQNMHF